MTIQSFAQLNALKIGPKKKSWYSTHDWLQDLSQSFRAFLQLFTEALKQNNYSQKNILHKKFMKRKLRQNWQFIIGSELK